MVTYLSYICVEIVLHLKNVAGDSLAGCVYFEFWQQSKSFPHLSSTDEKFTTGICKIYFSQKNSFGFYAQMSGGTTIVECLLAENVNQDFCLFINISLVLGCWLGQALWGRPSCQYSTGRQSSFFALRNHFVVK